MTRRHLLLIVSLWIGAGGATADAQIDESLPTFEISPIPVPKSQVFFAPGTVALSTAARRTLDYQAAGMKAAPTTSFEIVGRTDTHEVVNKDASFGLGYRRATVVRDYLIAKGVPPRRLRIKSRGYEGVIVLNESDAAMAGLRVVSTEFLPDDR